MGKTIESPVKKWPGSVTLYEPMDFPQYLSWKRAVNEASALIKDEQVPWDEYDAAIAPGILACVEKWELEGIPEHPTFIPANPRLASHNLIIWLMHEISGLITSDESVPKD